MAPRRLRVSERIRIPFEVAEQQIIADTNEQPER
mgnify:CR=1 FL=1